MGFMNGANTVNGPHPHQVLIYYMGFPGTSVPGPWRLGVWDGTGAHGCPVLAARVSTQDAEWTYPNTQTYRYA